jgi:protein-disulfide isomerase
MPRLSSKNSATISVRFALCFIQPRRRVSNGTESHLAALAALCAGDQKMFWEYHDLLFASQGAENSGSFSTPRLQLMAAQLHVDGVRFDQCLNQQTHANVIDGDIRRLQHYKLNYTPAFIVDGVKVTGSTEDFHSLFDAIDRALLAAG